jgi:hypothetical protein
MKPLDRLRQQYIETQKSVLNYNRNLQDYNSVRLFCLVCELVSFNDIEVMENEINNQAIQDSIDVDSWSK